MQGAWLDVTLTHRSTPLWTGDRTIDCALALRRTSVSSKPTVHPPPDAGARSNGMRSWRAIAAEPSQRAVQSQAMNPGFWPNKPGLSGLSGLSRLFGLSGFSVERN